MRILSAKIRNFRSITDATVTFGPYTVVVGTNNSGKSNVVDALLTFWGKRDFARERDMPRMKGLAGAADVWIEVDFRLTDEEYDSLKEEYRIGDHLLRIRHAFVIGGKDNDKVSAYAVGADKTIALSDNDFYGWADTTKLGVIVAIPALSRLDDHMKMSGTTAFNQMLAPFIKDLFADDGDPGLRKATDDMVASISAMGEHVRRTAGDIERAINEDLGGWGLTFGMGTEAPDPKKLLTDSISHTIMDPSVGDGQPASSFGQGFQRHLIYVLLKLRAMRGARSGKPKADDTAKPVRAKKAKPGAADAAVEAEPKRVFAPSFFFLLFEEPEAFLHPSQLDALHRTLLRLTGDAAQVLVTTHSPQMASHNIADLTAFARVVRIGGVSSIHQVGKARLDEILNANTAEVARWKATPGFPAVAPDDLLLEMETVKHAIWLNPLRSKAFFADRVLLVEGPTEVALFGWMSDNGFFGSEMDGVVVVDTLGKFNMHRFMTLFGDLGIAHAVLRDGDSGKYAATVDATIAGARNPMTLGIGDVPHDVERFLGLPECKDNRRKPQNMMFAIGRGLVAEGKLRALGAMVGGLVTVPPPSA